jgi:hypothetical protein
MASQLLQMISPAVKLIAALVHCQNDQCSFQLEKLHTVGFLFLYSVKWSNIGTDLKLNVVHATTFHILNNFFLYKYTLKAIENLFV